MSAAARSRWRTHSPTACAWSVSRPARTSSCSRSRSSATGRTRHPHPSAVDRAFDRRVRRRLDRRAAVHDGHEVPIQYALLYPDRVPAPFARLDLSKISKLDFQPVDPKRFPAVQLAYAALRAGGSMPAVLNAANEIAVERFLAGELPFVGIVDIVNRVLDRHAGQTAAIGSVEDALHWDGWARNEARGIRCCTEPLTKTKWPRP